MENLLAVLREKKDVVKGQSAVSHVRWRHRRIRAVMLSLVLGMIVEF